MVKLPRSLMVLGALAVLLGGFGGSRALMDQILPYLGSHDAFVAERRQEIELRNQLMPAEADGGAVSRAGDALGEQAWTRRGIVLPLGVANLLLSLMLFIGGLRAMSGSPWGHGAWQFAAKLSVPYTLVAAAVAFVSARDGWDANLVLAAGLAKTKHVPSAFVADVQLYQERGLVCLGAALAITYYLWCVIVLRRPSVKALFAESQ